jgi:hypothetical protein
VLRAALRVPLRLASSPACLSIPLTSPTTVFIPAYQYRTFSFSPCYALHVCTWPVMGFAAPGFIMVFGGLRRESNMTNCSCLCQLGFKCLFLFINWKHSFFIFFTAKGSW